MPRAIWLSDLHLNFVCDDPQGPFDEEYHRFVEDVRRANADLVLVGGDLAEAPTLTIFLDRIVDDFSLPIYFVLGNHDCYRGSIAASREVARNYQRPPAQVCYLSASDVVPLGEKTALIGHDGWADGRCGNYEWSRVKINDYTYIQEFILAGEEHRLATLHALGDEAADHMRRVLPQALSSFEHVVLLTHVPPFQGAAWHREQLCDYEWAPHFACAAAGEAILEAMSHARHRRLTVLCGHTHGAGEYRPLPNVVVWTAGAEYGQPTIQRVLDLE